MLVLQNGLLINLRNLFATLNEHDFSFNKYCATINVRNFFPIKSRNFSATYVTFSARDIICVWDIYLLKADYVDIIEYLYHVYLFEILPLVDFHHIPASINLFTWKSVNFEFVLISVFFINKVRSTRISWCRVKKSNLASIVA